MAKYSEEAQEKVHENLHELKEGTLRSSGGQKVKSRKQAIAIGLSEARENNPHAAPKKAEHEKS
jgi:hypothetical protein